MVVRGMDGADAGRCQFRSALPTPVPVGGSRSAVVGIAIRPLRHFLRKTVAGPLNSHAVLHVEQA